MSEVIESVDKYKPDPCAIGNKLKDAFKNVGKIIEMLTFLYNSIPIESVDSEYKTQLIFVSYHQKLSKLQMDICLNPNGIINIKVSAT